MFRKEGKVLWRDGDDKRTQKPGVLVRKTQDGNRRNIWVVKLDDGRVVQALEVELKEI